MWSLLPSLILLYELGSCFERLLALCCSCMQFPGNSTPDMLVVDNNQMCENTVVQEAVDMFLEPIQQGLHAVEVSPTLTRP